MSHIARCSALISLLMALSMSAYAAPNDYLCRLGFNGDKPCTVPLSTSLGGTGVVSSNLTQGLFFASPCMAMGNTVFRSICSNDLATALLTAPPIIGSTASFTQVTTPQVLNNGNLIVRALGAGNSVQLWSPSSAALSVDDTAIFTARGFIPVVPNFFSIGSLASPYSAAFITNVNQHPVPAGTGSLLASCDATSGFNCGTGSVAYASQSAGMVLATHPTMPGVPTFRFLTTLIPGQYQSNFNGGFTTAGTAYQNVTSEGFTTEVGVNYIVTFQSCSSHTGLTGGTNSFRLTIDGVEVIDAATTVGGLGADKGCAGFVYRHGGTGTLDTFALDMKATAGGNGQIRPNMGVGENLTLTILKLR